MPDRSKDIGTRIRRLREERGLTQDQLAERCGVYGANVVSRWESGKQTPRLDTAGVLAEALGVPIDALVHDGAVVEGQRRPLEAQAARALSELDDGHLEAVSALLRKLLEAR